MFSLRGTVQTALISCIKAHCQCTVYRWQEPGFMGTWVQHGENPEARIFITDRDAYASRDNPTSVLERWLDIIHTYLEQPDD